METIRTFIIALFFAALTVGAYYCLNRTDAPWNTLVEKTASHTVPEVKIEEPSASAATNSSLSADFGNFPSTQLPSEETAYTPASQNGMPDASFPQNTSPNLELPALVQDNDTSFQLPTLNDPATSSPAAEPMPHILAAETESDLQLPTLHDMTPNFTPSHATGAIPEPAYEPDPFSVAATVPNSAPTNHVQPMNPAVKDYILTAQAKLNEGKHLEVLQKLSDYYGDPRLSQQESDILTSLLVQAATHVIYSQEHTLEAPYTVQPGDTLASIAEKYQVPPQFLERINAVSPMNLRPGMQLKVVRGPFHGKIYVDRYELILTLNGLFACRFWIGVGGDLVQKDGNYIWETLTLNPDYNGIDQVSADGRDPNNPLGGIACTFVDAQIKTPATDASFGPPSHYRMAIHPTTDASVIGRHVPRGSVILSRTDMESLIALLGKGSYVSLAHVSPHASGIQTASHNAGPTAINPPPVNAPTAPSVGMSANIGGSPYPQQNIPVNPLLSEPAAGEPVISPIHSSTGKKVSMPGFVSDEIPASPTKMDTLHIPDSIPAGQETGGSPQPENHYLIPEQIPVLL
ncbi:MAG: LysM domain-containing protein [Planctomycetia bacterium]|nr:LysM domain-containing protein [Planctomycetia bacterium]